MEHLVSVTCLTVITCPTPFCDPPILLPSLFTVTLLRTADTSSPAFVIFYPLYTVSRRVATVRMCGITDRVQAFHWLQEE